MSIESVNVFDKRFNVFLEFISNSRVNYSFTKMKILVGL